MPDISEKHVSLFSYALKLFNALTLLNRRGVDVDVF